MALGFEGLLFSQYIGGAAAPLLRLGPCRTSVGAATLSCFEAIAGEVGSVAAVGARSARAAAALLITCAGVPVAIVADHGRS